MKYVKIYLQSILRTQKQEELTTEMQSAWLHKLFLFSFLLTQPNLDFFQISLSICVSTQNYFLPSGKIRASQELRRRRRRHEFLVLFHDAFVQCANVEESY